MALKDPALWLIAYDIADPRRLGRSFRYLRKHAIPVQYSVFMVHCSRAKLGNILKGLEKHIHAREDDVRAYRIPEPIRADRLGGSVFPEGVMLFSNDGSAADTSAPAESLDGLLF